MSNSTRGLLSGGVALLCFSCACPLDAPRRLDGITQAEMHDITPVVRSQTRDCIHYFKRLPDGIIEVETGNSGYQGGGSLFHLRKSGGKWKIVEQLVWNA